MFKPLFQSAVVQILLGLTAAGSVQSCTHTPSDHDRNKFTMEQWYGRSGFCGENPKLFNDGVVSLSGSEQGPTTWLKRTYLEYGRTGLLKNALSVTSPDGNKVIDLPPGTKAFAASWRSPRTEKFRSKNFAPIDDDPIEWCFVRDIEIVACAEWFGDGRALYLTPADDQNLYVPELENFELVGPAPIIDEQHVTLGFHFVSEVNATLADNAIVLTSRLRQFADGVETVRPDNLYRPIFWQDAEALEFDYGGDSYKVSRISGDQGSKTTDAHSTIRIEREQKSWPLLPYCGGSSSAS